MPSIAAPFYFSNPPNPPPLHLLLVQTEIASPSPVVLAQEPIDLKQLDALATSQPHVTPLEPKSKSRSHVTFVTGSSAPSHVTPPAPASSPGAIADDDGAGSTDGYLSEEADTGPAEANTEPNLIEKPRGTYGHPGSGGYTLQSAVLSHKVIKAQEYARLKKVLNQLIETKLEKEFSYRKQNQAVIDHIVDTVVKKFPVMECFRDHWPVRDLLKSTCKTSAAKAKLEAAREKAAAEKAKEDTEGDAEKTRDGEIGPVRGSKRKTATL